MLFRFGLLLVLSACLAAGCFGGGDDEQPAKPPEITLRVATFNLFYGGDEMVLATRDWCTDPAGCQETFAAVVDAIKQSKADVVGLQEATGNTRKVAEALGWNYNERTQVISRFPIVDPGGADGLYVFVQPTPSTVVAVSNVHLAFHPLRALPRPGGLHRGPGPPPREPPPHAGHRRAGQRASAARGDGHPGLPHRRLQLALVSRLDGGGRRRARRHAIPGRVAGLQGARGRGLQGLVPRGESGSRSPGPALRGRPAGRRAPNARCTTASTGSSPWGRRRRPRAAWSGKPGTRTSTSRFRCGPRITARWCPPSA